MHDDDELLREGPAKRLVWGADGTGRRRAQEHFDALSIKEQASFDVNFRRMAETGLINNKEKFRHERSNLFVFKIFKQRLACFFDGRTVVLISGFTKKSDKDKKVKRELDTAEVLRNAYLDATKK